MNTIQILKHYAIQKLKGSYEQREIEAICRIIYMDLFHFSTTDIILKRDEPLSDEQTNLFYEIVEKLERHIPIQYIIGWSEFAGLKFGLNSDTLIPRPETEELIVLASKYIKTNDRILDIGTGSGCISITLAHLYPNAQVDAIDISVRALEQAKQNAGNNCTIVNFKQADILQFEQYTWPLYNIIISNPPYIRPSEKQMMDHRVLDYEPHLALFVTEEDPLIFYRKIAQFGLLHLTQGGYLFFEINEAFGDETCQLLQTMGYRHIQCSCDIHGRNRMVMAKKIM